MFFSNRIREDKYCNKYEESTCSQNIDGIIFRIFAIFCKMSFCHLKKCNNTRAKLIGGLAIAVRIMPDPAIFDDLANPNLD